jgi:L-fuculose-phosphate aldolase
VLLPDERHAVVAACRRLVADRLVVGTAGNVSVRAGDLVAVTPSGVDYARLTAAMVGVHRLDGTALEAPLPPTSELPMHLAIYAAGETGAVVHHHSVASTALSLVVDEIPTSHYYSALFGGAVRVAPYATFGTARLAEHVVTALRGRTGALMSNHGAVCTGGTLAQAHERVLYLDWLCDVQLRALGTGLPVRVLPVDEIERVATILGIDP